MTKPMNYSRALLGAVASASIGIVLWRVVAVAPPSITQNISSSRTQATTHVIADDFHRTANLPATPHRGTAVEMKNQAARRSEGTRPLPPPMRAEARHQVHGADTLDNHEQALAALQADVVVLSVGVDVPGQEYAVVAIEGRPDQVLSINAEIRDGFIVRAITHSGVALDSPFGGELFLPLLGSDYAGNGQVQLTAFYGSARPQEFDHGAVQDGENAEHLVAEPALRIPPFRYYGPGHHVSPARQ